MKTTSHSVISRSISGGKNSAFCLLPSALLHGFTLLELMIATSLCGLVVAGTLSVYIMCNKIWRATALNMQTVRESSLALSRMVYGMDTNAGLRAASMIINTNFSNGSWRLAVSNSSAGVQYIYYNSPAQILSNANAILCNDVASASVPAITNGMIRIQLTVAKQDGMFRSSNTVSTMVKMRNAS
jgi:prepilin-type N-terminal cleavage/methylation domain-containing protein